jgi:hypothetical protein
VINCTYCHRLTISLILPLLRWRRWKSHTHVALLYFSPLSLFFHIKNFTRNFFSLRVLLFSPRSHTLETHFFSLLILTNDYEKITAHIPGFVWKHSNSTVSATLFDLLHSLCAQLYKLKVFFTFLQSCVCGSRASIALVSLHRTEDDVQLKSSARKCFSHHQHFLLSFSLALSLVSFSWECVSSVRLCECRSLYTFHARSLCALSCGVPQDYEWRGERTTRKREENKRNDITLWHLSLSRWKGNVHVL